MTQNQPLPNLEQVQQTSAKIKEVCQRADAGISILDDLIAQLDQQIRSAPMYSYRLNKAKHLLNIQSEI
ncbi:MAG TPA: hypothetical protein V6D15_19805 [Oculatellaceae cyanobacterium]|jgi:hypothetical protein